MTCCAESQATVAANVLVSVRVAGLLYIVRVVGLLYTVRVVVSIFFIFFFFYNIGAVTFPFQFAVKSFFARVIVVTCGNEGGARRGNWSAFENPGTVR